MKPRILAHRGASGYALENSLAAFREARLRGADGVELDVYPTSDGSFIVHHDPDLPGQGAIRDLPLAKIRGFRLSNGETIPTLAEALEALSGMEVWIEIKELPAKLDDSLLSLVRETVAVRGGVHSFDHRIIARLGAREPKLRRGILSASYPVDPVGPMLAAGASALWQQWHLVDRELVESIHRMGGEVIAWTVPDAEVATRLAGLGVDALCGNYPDRLRTR